MTLFTSCFIDILSYTKYNMDFSELYCTFQLSDVYSCAFSAVTSKIVLKRWAFMWASCCSFVWTRYASHHIKERQNSSIYCWNFKNL